MLAIDLPEELEERLNALAAAMGQPAAAVIQDAIAEYLSDLEDVATAEARMADIRAGLSRTYSLDEIERTLGLDD
jgi:RHH-type rel operon transcriptional repressor/antitoxin RelB